MGWQGRRGPSAGRATAGAEVLNNSNRSGTHELPRRHLAIKTSSRENSVWQKVLLLPGTSTLLPRKTEPTRLKR